MKLYRLGFMILLITNFCQPAFMQELRPFEQKPAQQNARPGQNLKRRRLRKIKKSPLQRLVKFCKKHQTELAFGAAVAAVAGAAVAGLAYNHWQSTLPTSAKIIAPQRPAERTSEPTMSFSQAQEIPRDQQAGSFADYAGADGRKYSPWSCKTRAWIYLQAVRALGLDKKYHDEGATKDLRCLNPPAGHTCDERPRAEFCYLTKLAKPFICQEDACIKARSAIAGEFLMPYSDAPTTRCAHERTADELLQRITITTNMRHEEIKAAYGQNRTCSISIGELQRMADTARIILDEGIISKDKFLSGKGGPREAFGVCHAMDIKFFVAPAKDNHPPDQDYPQLAEGNLDEQASITLLSGVGVDFRRNKEHLSFDENIQSMYGFNNHEDARPFIKSMWQGILAGAKLFNNTAVFSVTVGSGAFLPQEHPNKNQIAQMYFEELCEAMLDAEMPADFEGFYINHCGYEKELQAVLKEYKKQYSELPIFEYAGDVMLGSVQYSKTKTADGKTYKKCGYVNASAWPVLVKKDRDIGNHFKTLGEVQEETIGATSTAAFTGSPLVNDVYVNRSKIIERPRLKHILSRPTKP